MNHEPRYTVGDGFRLGLGLVSVVLFAAVCWVLFLLAVGGGAAFSQAIQQ